MVFRSKVKHKVLSGQSRELISSVLKFMKEEGELDAPIIPLYKVRERLAAATGVSIRTITRIAQETRMIENGEMASFSTPNKKILNRTSKVSLDDFDRGDLRRIIVDLHVREQTIPTVKKIHEKFSKSVGYRGSASTLQKEMKKIGFSWRKVKNKRRVLMERHEIRLTRIEFLRKMHAYREEGRPIIYMDESSMHSDNEGPRKSTSKGTCSIIINAGSKDGIRRNVYIKRKLNSGTDGNYKDVMNFEDYEKWIAKELIPELPERSVVVINNNPYHNKQVDNIPSVVSKKEDMQEWLRKSNVPFGEHMLQPELYEIINAHRPRRKQYKIDEIFLANGHDVLRLPSYHPDLNPIELVWAEMKQYMALQNVQFKFDDVASYCDQFFEQFTPQEWKARCEQVEVCEKEFMRQEPLIDTLVEDFLTGINDESDTDIDSDTGSEGESALNYDIMEFDQSS